jgi:branched-chain amino acid transport system ATP-binding protein
MTAPVLAAIGLTKRFGGIQVTNNVDLALEAGARHALIGPNGAGKTTLVGLLSGMVTPDSGRVMLHGRDITRLSPAARVKLGLIRTFQVNSLFPILTVFQNVFLAACERYGASRTMLRTAGHQRQAAESTWHALEVLGLHDEAARTIAEIAYGRRRLVEIAIALVLEPKVLLLDEPAAGIPSTELPTLLAAIGGLAREIAILIIEHDMQIVRHFAHTVTVLAEGEVLESGSSDVVMNSPKVRSVYLGKSGRARYQADRPHA